MKATLTERGKVSTAPENERVNEGYSRKNSNRGGGNSGALEGKTIWGGIPES